MIHYITNISLMVAAVCLAVFMVCVAVAAIQILLIPFRKDDSGEVKASK